MQKMNPEIKAKWVAALRSGEYEKGANRLRDKDNNFCCLGVLCNLHAQAHPEIAAQQTCRTHYMGATGFPPNEVIVWAGIDTTMVSIYGLRDRLANHNDDGRTFAEIADAIEAQL